MTNRREFLQTSVSVSSVPLALNVLLPPSFAAANSGRIAIHKAVFDDRYAEGNVFADTLRQLGVPVRALDNGDVTSFWYDELDLLWRERPAAIAGTTQFGPMFVLERLARERGMRIAMSVEHQPLSNGTMTHEVTGPPEIVELADRLQGRVDWPVFAAVLSAYCSAGCRSPRTRSFTTSSASPVPEMPAGPESPETVIHYYTSAAIRDGQGVPWDGPLFTWLIEPNGRV